MLIYASLLRRPPTRTRRRFLRDRETRGTIRRLDPLPSGRRLGYRWTRCVYHRDCPAASAVGRPDCSCWCTICVTCSRVPVGENCRGSSKLQLARRTALTMLTKTDDGHQFRRRLQICRKLLSPDGKVRLRRIDCSRRIDERVHRK